MGEFLLYSTCDTFRKALLETEENDCGRNRTDKYTEHQYTPDIYIISTKVWNKLSKEQQDYLLECFSKLNDNFVQKYNQMMDDAMVEAESYGVHVYRDIDKTTFIEAVQPIHQNFLAKGESYQKLYDYIQSYAEDTDK